MEDNLGQVKVLITPVLDRSRLDSGMTEAAEKMAARFDKAFTGKGQPLGRITGKVTEFEKSMEAANARVIAFGASAGGIYLVKSAFDKLVASTIDVEKNLTDINMVLGLGSSALKSFSADMFKAASASGQTFETASKVALEFARHGVSAAETTKRMTSAMQLMRISGLDAGESVDVLTASINAFSKEALTAEDVVNRLTAVDTKFAVSAQDLSKAIQRVGSSAADAGVQFNQLLGLVTAAQTQTSRGGAVIGNALKSIFTRASRPEIISDIQSVGVVTKDTAGQILPMMTILSNLAKQYYHLGSAQKSFVSEAVGGVYQVNILKALFSDLGNGISVYTKAAAVAAMSTGAVEKRMALLNETISSKLNVTANELTELFSNLGNVSFGGNMKKGLDGLNSSLDSVKRSLADFSEDDSAGAKLGKSFSRGLADAFGNILSGPGLQVGAMLLTKVIMGLGKFAIDAGKNMMGINDALKAQEGLLGSVTNFLQRNKSVLAELNAGQIKINDATTLYLKQLQNEEAYYASIAKHAKEIAGLAGPSLSVDAFGQSKKTGISAGYIPAFAQEERDARAKGASPNVRAMFGPNIPGIGPTIINSEEVVKQNYGGSGKPAILRTYGAPGPTKLSGGLVPNFANILGTINVEGVRYQKPDGEIQDFDYPFIDLLSMIKGKYGRQILPISAKSGKEAVSKVGRPGKWQDKGFNKPGAIENYAHELLRPEMFVQETPDRLRHISSSKQVFKNRFINKVGAFNSQGFENLEFLNPVVFAAKEEGQEIYHEMQTRPLLSSADEFPAIKSARNLPWYRGGESFSPTTMVPNKNIIGGPKTYGPWYENYIEKFLDAHPDILSLIGPGMNTKSQAQLNELLRNFSKDYEGEERFFEEKYIKKSAGHVPNLAPDLKMFSQAMNLESFPSDLLRQTDESATPFSSLKTISDYSHNPQMRNILLYLSQKLNRRITDKDADLLFRGTGGLEEINKLISSGSVSTLGSHNQNSNDVNTTFISSSFGKSAAYALKGFRGERLNAGGIMVLSPSVLDRGFKNSPFEQEAHNSITVPKISIKDLLGFIKLQDGNISFQNPAKDRKLMAGGHVPSSGVSYDVINKSLGSGVFKNVYGLSRLSGLGDVSPKEVILSRFHDEAAAQTSPDFQNLIQLRKNNPLLVPKVHYVSPDNREAIIEKLQTFNADDMHEMARLHGAPPDTLGGTSLDNGGIFGKINLIKTQPTHKKIKNRIAWSLTQYLSEQGFISGSRASKIPGDLHMGNLGASMGSSRSQVISRLSEISKILPVEGKRMEKSSSRLIEKAFEDGLRLLDVGYLDAAHGVQQNLFSGGHVPNFAEEWFGSHKQVDWDRVKKLKVQYHRVTGDNQDGVTEDTFINPSVKDNRIFGQTWKTSGKTGKKYLGISSAYLDSVVKYKPSYASGYIPNFSDPISEAFKRENSLTAKLGFSSKVKSSGNPGGALVYDSSYQRGPEDAIRQHLLSGRPDVQNAGTPNEKIPNFAMDMSAISSLALGGLQGSGLGDWAAKKLPGISYGFDKMQHAVGTATEQLLMMKKKLESGQSVKYGGKSYDPDQSAKLETAFKKAFDQKFKGKGFEFGTSKEKLTSQQEAYVPYAKRLQEKEQSIRSKAFGASMIAPMVGGIASQGLQAFGAINASKAMTALTDSATMAAQFMIAFPTKVGTALSGAVMASGISNAINEMVFKTGSLARSFDLISTRLEKTASAVGMVNQSYESLDAALKSGTMSVSQLVTLQRNLAKSYGELAAVKGGGAIVSEMKGAGTAEARNSAGSKAIDAMQNEKNKAGFDLAFAKQQQSRSLHGFNVGGAGPQGNLTPRNRQEQIENIELMRVGASNIQSEFITNQGKKGGDRALVERMATGVVSQSDAKKIISGAKETDSYKSLEKQDPKAAQAVIVELTRQLEDIAIPDGDIDAYKASLTKLKSLQIQEVYLRQNYNQSLQNKLQAGSITSSMANTKNIYGVQTEGIYAGYGHSRREKRLGLEALYTGEQSMILKQGKADKTGIENETSIKKKAITAQGGADIGSSINETIKNFTSSSLGAGTLSGGTGTTTPSASLTAATNYLSHRQREFSGEGGAEKLFNLQRDSSSPDDFAKKYLGSEAAFTKAGGTDADYKTLLTQIKTMSSGDVNEKMLKTLLDIQKVDQEGNVMQRQNSDKMVAAIAASKFKEAASQLGGTGILDKSSFRQQRREIRRAESRLRSRDAGVRGEGAARLLAAIPESKRDYKDPYIKMLYDTAAKGVANRQDRTMQGSGIRRFMTSGVEAGQAAVFDRFKGTNLPIPNSVQQGLDKITAGRGVNGEFDKALKSYAASLTESGKAVEAFVKKINDINSRPISSADIGVNQKDQDAARAGMAAAKGEGSKMTSEMILPITNNSIIKYGQATLEVLNAILLALVALRLFAGKGSVAAAAAGLGALATRAASVIAAPFKKVADYFRSGKGAAAGGAAAGGAAAGGAAAGGAAAEGAAAGGAAVEGAAARTVTTSSAGEAASATTGARNSTSGLANAGKNTYYTRMIDVADEAAETAEKGVTKVKIRTGSGTGSSGWAETGVRNSAPVLSDAERFGTQTSTGSSRLGGAATTGAEAGANAAAITGENLKMPAGAEPSGAGLRETTAERNAARRASVAVEKGMVSGGEKAAEITGRSLENLHAPGSGLGKTFVSTKPDALVPTHLPKSVENAMLRGSGAGLSPVPGEMHVSAVEGNPFKAGASAGKATSKMAEAASAGKNILTKEFKPLAKVEQALSKAFVNLTTKLAKTAPMQAAGKIYKTAAEAVAASRTGQAAANIGAKFAASTTGQVAGKALGTAAKGASAPFAIDLLKEGYYSAKSLIKGGNYTDDTADRLIEEQQSRLTEKNFGSKTKLGKAAHVLDIAIPSATKIVGGFAQGDIIEANEKEQGVDYSSQLAQWAQKEQARIRKQGGNVKMGELMAREGEAGPLSYARQKYNPEWREKHGLAPHLDKSGQTAAPTGAAIPTGDAAAKAAGTNPKSENSKTEAKPAEPQKVDVKMTAEPLSVNVIITDENGKKIQEMQQQIVQFKQQLEDVTGNKTPAMVPKQV